MVISILSLFLLLFPFSLAQTTFTGRVWNDANGNGVQEPTENGINGVLVQAFSLTGPLLSQTFTINGTYSLSVSEASIFLRVNRTAENNADLLPPFLSPTDVFSNLVDSVDSDGVVIDGSSALVVVSDASTTTDFDFGFTDIEPVLSPSSPPDFTVIGGVVFIDSDANGIYIEDPTVSGVEIFVRDTDTREILFESVTDVNGIYIFERIEPFSDFSIEIPLSQPAIFNRRLILIEPDQGGSDLLDSDAVEEDGFAVTRARGSNAGDIEVIFSFGFTPDERNGIIITVSVSPPLASGTVMFNASILPSFSVPAGLFESTFIALEPTSDHTFQADVESLGPEYEILNITCTSSESPVMINVPAARITFLYAPDDLVQCVFSFGLEMPPTEPTVQPTLPPPAPISPAPPPIFQPTLPPTIAPPSSECDCIPWDEELIVRRRTENSGRTTIIEYTVGDSEPSLLSFGEGDTSDCFDSTDCCNSDNSICWSDGEVEDGDGSPFLSFRLPSTSSTTCKLYDSFTGFPSNSYGILLATAADGEDGCEAIGDSCFMLGSYSRSPIPVDDGSKYVILCLEAE